MPKVIIFHDSDLDKEYQRGLERLGKLSMKPQWRWNNGAKPRFSQIRHVSTTGEKYQRSENKPKVC